MPRRVLLGALILVVALGVGISALRAASSTTAVQTVGHTEWRRVDLPGEVAVLGRHPYPAGELRVGSNDDNANIAVVRHGEASFPYALESPPLEPVRALDAEDGLVFATKGGPEEDRPAHLWFGDEYDGEQLDTPSDAKGRQPVWLEPTFDGEGDFRVLGVAPEGDRWRVQAWLDTGTWVRGDVGPGLYTSRFPEAGDLLVSATETTLEVAGMVSDGTGTEHPQFWFVGDGAAYDDAPDYWHREQLVPEPDALTDLECWELGCWLAGAIDGRPVVYDFDTKSGAPIDLPAIELDPAQPTVLIAGFSQRHPILAAQAADGPQVWYRDGGEWHEVPAPAGRIQSVRRVQRLVYLQLDGELWYTTLPKPGAPAATLAAHGIPAGLLRPS